MLNGDDLPPLLHGHCPASSLLRGSPPLSGASVLSASRLEPLAPCMGSLLSSGFRAAISLSCFLDRFLCSAWNPVSSPRPAVLQSRRAQELSRLAVALTFPRALPLPGHTLAASSTTARSVRSGRRSEGSSLSGADQSRHNLVCGGSKDPNHDAVMRIGSEAPKRRTHSFPRHKSQGTSRDSATSNRHRRPVSSGRTRPETVGCLQRPPFIAPGAEPRHLAPRPRAPGATRRSEACAPRPRSWSCEYRGRSRYGLETTAPRHCLSGT